MKNNTRTNMRRNQQQPSQGFSMKGGMALVAGAAIGGAMMYLFDPKVGAARRRQISQAAHGAMDQGKDALGAAIGTVAAHAGEVAEHLRSHLQDASDSMAAMASDAANSAVAAGSGMMRNASSSMKHAASDAQDQAMSFTNRQLRKIGNMLPHDREHHYVGQTTCALGSLALGAGAIYFFDPDNGARHRSEFRHRCFSALKSAGELCNATGRYLRDRMMGESHESESVFSSSQGSMESSSIPMQSPPARTVPPQGVSNLSA